MRLMALGLAALLFACEQRDAIDQATINRILSESEWRNMRQLEIRSVMEQINMSHIYKGYVDRISAVKSVDVTNCPTEFVVAFHDYTNALDEQARIWYSLQILGSDNNDDYSTNAVEMLGQEKLLKEQEGQAQGRVKKALIKMQAIAHGYGVEDRQEP